MSSRGRKSIADMARSLGLLLAVILPAVLVWAVIAPDASVPPEAVDPDPVIARAVAAGQFAVVAPTATAGAWKATSARFSGPEPSEVAPSTLQIGYLTDSDEFAGFQQTNRPRADVLGDVVGAGPSAIAPATTRVAGATWERWSSERGETVLVQDRADSLLVVYGSASDLDLASLAAGLRPAAPSWASPIGRPSQ